LSKVLVNNTVILVFGIKLKKVCSLSAPKLIKLIGKIIPGDLTVKAR